MTTYHCGCGWTRKLRRGVCSDCRQRVVSSDEVKQEWGKYPKALTGIVDEDIARKKRKKQAELAEKQGKHVGSGLAGLRALRGK